MSNASTISYYDHITSLGTKVQGFEKEIIERDKVGYGEQIRS